MIQIAILGFGTVGKGVAKVTEKNAAQIEKRIGEPLQVKTILVRHFQEGPYRQLMTDDFSRIEEDDDISVVVETIGGVDAAYTYTKRALSAGKHVVTANKQLICAHGYELLQLARRHRVHYLFEASVGGGIPILHPLTQCIAGNRIEEVYGILNGTSNYILTQMVQNGASFADALKQAQQLGYAEADPTADVDGIDAGRKTCILGDLAFGRQIREEDVPMTGIRGISLEDVKIARRAGYRIKLLGRALRLAENQRTAYVAPHLIHEDSPMAHVEDVYNAIMVRGNAIGDVMFYGRGAGEMPTASAVVADVMECLLTSPRKDDVTWNADSSGFCDPQEVASRFYFRIDGSLSDALYAFGQVEVLSENGQTVFLTDAITEKKAKERAKNLSVCTCLRVLS